MITLANGADPDELLIAATAFERSGLLLLAAGAAAQAAAKLRDRNDMPGSATASARVAALIRRAGYGRSTRVALAPGVDRLEISRRERDVAALVAGGMSNRQIAALLHLSVRTVESHIYRACTRIGLADRAALAAAVTEVPGPDFAEALCT